MAKHNKLKNSGILFELLVRQMTTDTLNGIKDSKAGVILQKYFKNTELLKEYHIYDTIIKSKNLTETKADTLLAACTEAYKKLNKTTLRNSKYNLIAEIKKHYDIDDFFKEKVPNYKTLASVYLMLEMNDSTEIDIDKYVDCKTTLLEHIVSNKTPETTPIIEKFAQYDKGTRIAVYKVFIKKFNDKYSTLNEAQKGLLKEYLNTPITSPKLREYCNEQVKVIASQLKKMEATLEDDTRKVKIQEIAKLIKPVPDTKVVKESDITNLLHYQELLKEYNKIESK